MAGRIRTVKPELLQLHWFATLSDGAARTYYGLLGVVDDCGRCAADASFIGGQIFWGRQRSATVIGRQLAELERAGIIRRYVTRGGEYLEVLGWSDKGGPLYQQINKPQGERFPAPESDDDRPAAGPGDGRQTGTDPIRSEGNRIERESSRAIPPSPTPAPRALAPSVPALSPPPAPAPGASSWHDRKRWWAAMLAADQRLRAAGIEPSAPTLPAVCAGENEKGVNACARQLAESGYDAPTVDAKMLHIVLVAEAEALRERHRKWFKPALIFDPKRASRAADTSLTEAKRPRARPGDPPPPMPPRKSDPPPPGATVTDAERAEAKAALDEWRAKQAARAPPQIAPAIDEPDAATEDEYP